MFEIVDIFEKKYGRRLAKIEKKVSIKIPYSDEYTKFKKSETSSAHSFYEGACHIAGKLMKPKVEGGKREELDNAVRLTHLDIVPESVYALAYLSMILALIVGVVLVILFPSLYSVILTLVAVPLVFFVTKNVPHTMLKRWRVKSSSQLVSAILYMIVDIKRGSNLERSVYFTANRVAPPLSLDFMRMLWEFQVGKFATVQEALDNYTLAWKGVEDEFVDAIHLVISSQHQHGEQAQKTLDKATDVILEGVQDNMRHFAHSLKGPVSALHMLGIVLPVLLLIMLPLVASFMKIPGLYLIVVFDVALPLTVYLIAKRILAMRPGGISYTNLDVYLRAKQRKEKFIATLAAAGVFLLFSAGGLAYFLFEKGRGADFSQYTDPVFFLSLIAVAAIGFTIVTYLWLSNRKALKFKRQLERLENEFSSAAFQLGSRIDEGTPPELAFAKVARDTKGMAIHEFFSIIDYNLRVKGASLKEAIFGGRIGAINYFPSPTIRSVMQLLVEGAKKSLKSAASALLVISRYLRDKRRVYERLKDLLADTISNMQMQAGFFVAIIIAIVTSLSTMIIRVMSSLAGVFRGGLLTGSTEGIGVAAPEGYEGIQNLALLFNMQNAVPAYQFQLMVGVYLILVVLLLSYVLTLVIYGGDKVELKQIMVKNLLRSMIIYCIAVVILHSILGSITAGIVKGTVAG